MKNLVKFGLVVGMVLNISAPSFAQSSGGGESPSKNLGYLQQNIAAGVYSASEGGADLLSKHLESLTDEDKRELRDQLIKNLEMTEVELNQAERELFAGRTKVTIKLTPVLAAGISGTSASIVSLVAYFTKNKMLEKKADKAYVISAIAGGLGALLLIRLDDFEELEVNKDQVDKLKAEIQQTLILAKALNENLQ